MALQLNKKVVIIASIILLVSLIAGSMWYFRPDNQPQAGTQMKASQSIPANLQSDANNHIFADKITALGFETFLQTEGPFTIFMPTDVAFERLPELAKEEMNDPTNEGSIRQLVLYHVVKGRYLTSNLTEGMTLETIQGEEITFNQMNGKWVINNYSVISNADIQTKNGVIHIVDDYLLPQSLNY